MIPITTAWKRWILSQFQWYHHRGVGVSHSTGASDWSGFFRSDTTDTISWVLSEDDFAVGDLNYIVGYRVYDPEGVLLTTLNPGTDTWTSASLNDHYDVIAIDACDNESTPLRIASICVQSPSITINSPSSGATVSGTVNIVVTTDPPSGRDIATVQLRINDDPWIDISGPSPWESEWETTALPNGSYTITVRSTDNAGVY